MTRAAKRGLCTRDERNTHGTFSYRPCGLVELESEQEPESLENTYTMHILFPSGECTGQFYSSIHYVCISSQTKHNTRPKLCVALVSGFDIK